MNGGDRRAFVPVALLPWIALAAACAGSGGDEGAGDAGMDAGGDASDSGTDAGGDAGDSGTDAGGDAGDSGTDAGDRTCETDAGLAEGSPISGDTTGMVDDLWDYSCTPLDESGPDAAFSFANAGDLPLSVTVQLTGMSADLDLFLLMDACDADACVAHSAGAGDESASAALPAGSTLFVSVDGYQGAAGAFDLTLFAEPMEDECADGLDGDEDGLTDCADVDCADDPACAAQCEPHASASCHHEWSDTTAGGASQIDSYPSVSGSFAGPERIYEIAGPPEGVAVEVALIESQEGLELFVAEGVCSSAALVAGGGTGPLAIATAPGVPYFAIVDGPDEAGGGFSIGIACRESSCGDASDNDDDGLTDCGDPDCVAEDGCATHCVPLSEDAGCPEPQADGGADGGATGPLECYLVEPSPLSGICHEPGDAGAGDPCSLQWDCGAGLVCTPADICLAACDLSDGDPGCDAGSCTSIGADPLGICW